MASRKRPPNEYYRNAARALAKKFPSAKKYRRRKKFRPAEKAAIARLINIVEAVGWNYEIPNEQRPDHLKFYVYPAERLPGYKRRASPTRPLDAPGDHGRSDDSLIRRARELVEGFPDDFARIARKKTNEERGRPLHERILTDAERKLIIRREKRMRYANNLQTLNQAQIETLKSQKRWNNLKFSDGANFIKLRRVEADAQLIVTREGMTTRAYYPKPKNIRLYRMIAVNRRGAAQFKAIMAAAQKLAAEGAKQFYVWTNHGLTSIGARDPLELAAMLGDEAAMSQVAEESGEDRVIQIESDGFRLAFQAAKKKRRRDKLSNVVWIKGVAGLYERKESAPLFPWEKAAEEYAIETGQFKRRKKR